MKEFMKKGFSLVLLMVFVFAWELTVQAEENNTIKTGVFAGQ